MHGETAPTTDDLNRFLAAEFPDAFATGLRCESIAPGTATARWLFDEERLRPGDYIPGIALFAVADAALWFATFSEIGIEPMAVTAELSIRYLRPAQGGDVLARAEVDTVTRSRVAGSLRLWVDHSPDTVVAVAQGTYARPRPAG